MPLASHHKKAPASRSRSRRGLFHTAINFPEADYARFKALCAARRTSMTAQLQAFVRNQISEPDVLLSESLYLPVSPELKKELRDYARTYNLSVTDLLIEAFGLLQRQREQIRMPRPDSLAPDFVPYQQARPDGQMRAGRSPDRGL